MVVERQLRQEGKSRHDLGRDEFTKRVWVWKEQSGNRIYDQLRVMGFSLDWSRERFTMDEPLSRAVRHVFVSLYKDGLSYRDKRLINWCPRCTTALSDLEVDSNDRQGSLWSIAYPVEGDESRKLVVSTTRPETMLGDTAVAVHPDDPRYQDLIGKRVRLPLTGRSIPVIADAILVDMAFGTGVVKVTPAHDFNDYETGKRHGLETISILDESAILNENAPEAYRGLDTIKARKAVLHDLEAQGLLVETKPHALKIPLCQRCATVVEPMISIQWFVKMKPLARPAIHAVENGFTKIYPEGWDKTYYHWMRNIQDWCISRQLWWGHQIPAWYGPDGTLFVAESEADALAEAKARYGADAVAVPFRHEVKVFFDELQRTGAVHKYNAAGFAWRGSAADPQGLLPENTVPLYRDPDVLDTWFSSALWPFSTLGWPDKTPDLAKFYPNSVLETGFDILFFWVARMMVMGLYCMGEVPFRAVYLHGLVRDDEGEKMSKTKGNVIDPLDVVYGISGADFFAKTEKAAREVLSKEADVQRILDRTKAKFAKGIPALGVDALRFALSIQATAGRDIKFDVSRVESYRTFANKLWNASRFGLMNLEGFSPESFAFDAAQSSIYDRWLRHRLGEVSAEVDAQLEAMDFANAAQNVYHFFWNEFCDWYIELSKRSLSAEATPEARAQAQGTLVLALDVALRLLHPFMPFITEEIWQKLPRLGSAQGGSAESPAVMIAPFPRPARAPHLRAATPADVEASSVVQLVRDVVTALRNVSSELRVPDSKPLGTAYIKGPAEAIALLTRELSSWKRLARINELLPEEQRPQGPSASGLITHALGTIEVSISLANLVDLDAEEARLSKEIAKAQKELEKIRQKLANPTFAANAPKEIVEKEREKEANEANRLDTFSAQLADIKARRAAS
jgi:valyl-tRNA synthetase